MAMKMCFWFIHPLDADTNRYVAQSFEGRTGDYEHHDKECADGVRRNLWECPKYDLIIRLKNDLRKLSLKFQIFRRRGLYGPIELWPVSEDDTQISKPSVQKSSPSRSLRSRRKTLATLTKTPGVMRGSRVPMPQQIG